MEIVATGSSRGHAKVSADMKITVKDSAIQNQLDLMRVKLRMDDVDMDLSHICKIVKHFKF